MGGVKYFNQYKITILFIMLHIPCDICSLSTPVFLFSSHLTPNNIDDLLPAFT